MEDRASGGEGGKTKRESRRSSDGRRRTPISEIFPETQSQMNPGSPKDDQEAHRNSLASLSPPASIAGGPLVRVEEATADGHSAPTDDEREPMPASALAMSPGGTPSKRVRPRPVSEQMLGRPRPQAICDNSEGDGTYSESAGTWKQ